MGYSYDPADLAGMSVSRMRLELGDTQVDGGANTCALSDGEISALIERELAAGGGWHAAKVACLRAIVMRFAMSADLRAGGMSIELSQRYERYRKLLEDAERLYQTPSVHPAALGRSRPDGGHYFFAGMNDNPRAR